MAAAFVAANGAREAPAAGGPRDTGSPRGGGRACDAGSLCDAGSPYDVGGAHDVGVAHDPGDRRGSGEAAAAHESRDERVPRDARQAALAPFAPLGVRPAGPADAAALRALRNHYITASDATFDDRPLAADDIVAWMHGFADTGRYRLLVAERGGRLAGFACSQRHRAHPAYRLTVETGVYVAPGETGRGVGSALYDALFALLAGEALHRAVAGIALPNEASIRLHRRHGLTEVGRFDECAVKNGAFVSALWMQRALAGAIEPAIAAPPRPAG